MANKRRVKGGETNDKSGQRWSRDELLEVLQVYVTSPDLKIHESNIVVQELGNKLGRTSRSVEAQLLMFRNLDKFGMYGFKNMNKLCKVLWKQYIDHQIYNNQ